MLKSALFLNMTCFYSITFTKVVITNIQFFLANKPVISQSLGFSQTSELLLCQTRSYLIKGIRRHDDLSCLPYNIFARFVSILKYLDDVSCSFLLFRYVYSAFGNDDVNIFILVIGL